MDIVLVFNGLGNQMSQYAFFLSKRKKCKWCWVMFPDSSKDEHNGSELDRLFNVKYPSYLVNTIFGFLYRIVLSSRTSKLAELLHIRFIREKRNYDYDPGMLIQGKWGINFYRGGWHCEKYFKYMEAEIKKKYTFPESFDEEYNIIKQLIMSDNGSVSIHVRRGDYVNISPDSYFQFGGVATTEYYHSAMEYIKERVPQCCFYVFSDDIEWCKQNIHEERVRYVTCNTGTNSWRDMELMSLCHHHINANSTFSWWGAWLCKYDDSITICPSKFIRTVETKDFYPEKWIKM